MSLGFVDALLPSVLAGEGPATKQRTGDALNWGKMRLHGIAPLPNGTTRQEFYLWHYYGDPSMQMWGGGNAPIVLNPALVKATYKPGPISIPDPPPYEVAVNLGQPIGPLAGQPISLLRRRGRRQGVPGGRRHGDDRCVVRRRLGEAGRARGRVRGRRRAAVQGARPGRAAA